MARGVRLQPHALDRMRRRGATELEVRGTIEDGESFSAKYGRTGFRRNFPFQARWRNQYYATKQLEVYAVEENDEWVVITVVVKYF